MGMVRFHCLGWLMLLSCHNVLVPFEIHQSSGILTISSTGGLKELKPSYNLEVAASDDTKKISTAVTIHITKDPQDDASIEQFADKLNESPETLEYTVTENLEGNCSIFDGASDMIMNILLIVSIIVRSCSC